MNKRLFPPINRSVTTNIPSERFLMGKGTIHIFDGGGGYYSTEEFPAVLPEGAVIYCNSTWGIKVRNGIRLISKQEIPAEVRTTMLILSLSL